MTSLFSNHYSLEFHYQTIRVWHQLSSSDWLHLISNLNIESTTFFPAQITDLRVYKFRFRFPSIVESQVHPFIIVENVTPLAS